jgi:hypothetical protein
VVGNEGKHRNQQPCKTFWQNASLEKSEKGSVCLLAYRVQLAATVTEA